MAKQRFTAAFREALWTVHHKKCAYCDREILYTELKVDHVIPESALENIAALTDFRTRFGLPADFDILGYENLAPACDACNSKKSDLLLKPGFVAIVLGKVESRIAALCDLLDARKKEKDIDSILRLVAASLEAGKFTNEELLTRLENLRRFPDGIRGASPLAAPSSPEERRGLYLSDRNAIRFTKHAHERMRERAFTVQDVISALRQNALTLRKAGRSGVFSVGLGEMEVTFKLENDVVQVLSVVYR